jgi:RNA polymerase sigma-70 factor (ECF subfamily)
MSAAAMPQLDLAYSATRRRAELAEAGDREVVSALCAGDEQALDELIERKTKPLLQLAYRILGDREEARDVVQVTFFKIWEKRARFDSRWSPNTWIYRIASNVAIDQLRARQSRERAAEPVRNHLRQVAAGRHVTTGAAYDHGEVMAVFRDLAGELSDKQRVIFVLREIEGLSSHETAEVVGCRESTVRNHLFNARRTLRRELLRRYPEYLPPAAAAAEARS